MGAPNNQSTKLTLDDFARQRAYNPKAPLHEEDLHALGLDTEIVAGTYDKQIRPYLDVLRGYQPLDSFENPAYRPNEWFDEQKQTYVSESWGRVLQRFGQAGQHRQVLEVITIRWQSTDAAVPAEIISAAVYMTRDGDWLLWSGGGRRSGTPRLINEQLTWYGNVRSLLEGAAQLIPDSYRPMFRTGQPPRYLPLTLEKGLRALLRGTISIKEAQLASLKQAYADAESRSANITPSNHH